MFGLSAYAIAILLALNALTFGLWRNSANEVARIEVAAATSKADNARKIEVQEQITEDTTNGWKAALDTTARYYAVRLRNAGRREVPAISDTTARPDAASADTVPAATRVEEECAYTTLTANLLQDWIAAQGKEK